MRVRWLMAAMIAMTLANAAMLSIQLSTGARARVAGMDMKALLSDEDFSGAVTAIVRRCQIYALPAISCQ